MDDCRSPKIHVNTKNGLNYWNIHQGRGSYNICYNISMQRKGMAHLWISMQEIAIGSALMNLLGEIFYHCEFYYMAIDSGQVIC